MSPPVKLIFVYGTLKRGGSNHLYLAGQTFVGEARTSPGFTLFDLEGYPGMVADPTAQEGVTGEVWSVDAAALAHLDGLEGLADGLYRREPVPLLAPFDQRRVEGYLYARSTKGRTKIGSTWKETR
jgi:gamma-glutamylaminecyclotransferase